MDTLLHELVEITLLELSPNEVARLLGTCKALHNQRERFWKYYWAHCLFQCQGCCEVKCMQWNELIVVAFDPSPPCDATYKPCFWPHPKRERECWIFCTTDCLNTYSLENIIDSYNGHLIRLHQRIAEYRNDDWWDGCDRAIAWPAWPLRIEGYHPKHTW
jgi:hypothetical protein